MYYVIENSKNKARNPGSSSLLLSIIWAILFFTLIVNILENIAISTIEFNLVSTVG